MQAVTAGAAGAIAAGAVAREVDEGVPAVRRLAAPQPLRLARHDDEGEGHAAVGCQVVGERGVRREVVHVPVVAVVVAELRRGARGGDQRVDERGGGLRVGRGEDVGEPRPYVVDGAEVLLVEFVHAAHPVASGERVQRLDVGEPVDGPVALGPLALGRGVHQIDHRFEGDPGVVGDQHASAPWPPAGRPPADAG